MKILIILFQLFGLASLIPWLLALMTAPMLFDSPDSTHKLFPYLTIIGLFLYPVLMGFAFWYAWQMQDLRYGVLLSSLPFVLCLTMLFFINS